MSHNQKIIFVVAFLGSLILAFVLGRLSVSSEAEKQSDIKIISSQDLKDTVSNAEEIEIRASAQGSKFYFPWCKSTFNEENTIYFKSIEEAQEKGYEQASGCLLEPN